LDHIRSLRRAVHAHLVVHFNSKAARPGVARSDRSKVQQPVMTSATHGNVRPLDDDSNKTDGTTGDSGSWHPFATHMAAACCICRAAVLASVLATVFAAAAGQEGCTTDN